eukprot:1659680-Amphidinium_carterae.1
MHSCASLWLEHVCRGPSMITSDHKKKKDPRELLVKALEAAQQFQDKNRKRKVGSTSHALPKAAAADTLSIRAGLSCQRNQLHL